MEEGERYLLSLSLLGSESDEALGMKLGSSPALWRRWILFSTTLRLTSPISSHLNHLFISMAGINLGFAICHGLGLPVQNLLLLSLPLGISCCCRTTSGFRHLPEQRSD
jgi:hypothetical protein